MSELTVHLLALRMVAEGLPPGRQATVENAIAEIVWLRTMAERIRAADAKFGHFAAMHNPAATDGSLLRCLAELASLVREAAKGGA
jgi:hypothetical protein